MQLGRLFVRVIVGGLFFGHGAQKLFGWFGGGGPEGTGEFFESLGLRPGKRHALAAGAAEAGGGLLLAAGLATPLAAASLSGVMITAIRKVHAQNGPWAGDGGFEYNLVLLGLLFALSEAGPGRWSVDEALSLDARGTRWALAELGAAALGSTLALASSEPAPAPAAAEEPTSEGEAEAA